MLNRLYLDYYRGPTHFWTELGLVFRNCRKYNTDEESDIRVLCDTLREASIVLYGDWHRISLDNYNYLSRLAQPNPESDEYVMEKVR